MELSQRKRPVRAALATGLSSLMLWSAVCVGGAEVLGATPAFWLVYAGGAAVILTAMGLAMCRKPPQPDSSSHGAL